MWESIFIKIKTNQSSAMKQCVVFSQQQSNTGKTAKLQWELYTN